MRASAPDSPLTLAIDHELATPFLIVRVAIHIEVAPPVVVQLPGLAVGFPGVEAIDENITSTELLSVKETGSDQDAC